MKKIFKKFWGVAFVVVLLSTLFVGTIPQASAGVLAFTYANLPGGTIGNLRAANANAITAPGVTIKDFVVASDGSIYAATNAAVYGAKKSITGGRTWFPLVTGLASTDLVAVAPDNPLIVAFVDTANKVVRVSRDGGASFSTGLPPIKSLAGIAPTALYDVDIAPLAIVAGESVNVVAVAGANASAPALYYLNYGVEFATWKEALDDDPILETHYTSTARYFKAVKFSPNFSRDYVAYVVGDTTGFDVYLNIVSFNSNQWNIGIPAFQYYADAGILIDGAPTSVIDKAQVGFDPNYLAGDETTRVTYISADYGNGTGGFYRVKDDAGPLVSANLKTTSTWSFGLNAEGTTLVAASANGSATWTMLTPTSAYAVFTPSRTVKRSGGGVTEGFSTAADCQTIAFAGTNVVLARGSTEGAFALSSDNGYTFNDISLVNTTVTDIRDHVVAPNGVQRYVISYNGTDTATSVFYWDGTYWERVLTILSSHDYVAKASPNNFNILYLADKTTALIRYTATAGKVNWLERTSPITATALADLEVQDDTTLWVATTVAAGGAVTKLSETGNIWPVGPPYYNVLYATGTITSLSLVGPNKVIACGDNGKIVYSNGGVAWVPIVGLTGTVYATASDLTAGSIIYATTNSGVAKVWTWTLGTSLAWSIAWYTAPITVTSYDLEIYNGGIYLIAANSTPVTLLARAILPAFSGWEEIDSTTIPAPTAATKVPDVLKFSVDPASVGNQVWFTDDAAAGLTPAYDQILTLTDDLIVTPPTIFSKDGVLIQVNRETGIAYNTTLSWNAASLAYSYSLQIAYDAAFTRLYTTATVTSYLPVINVVIGPLTGGGAIYVGYQPGETFYWRVRAILPYFSPWAGGYSITVQPIRAPVPELYSPANGGTVQTLRPGFSWTPMGGSVTYRFQIASDAAFTHIIQTTDVPAGGIDGAGVELTSPLVDGNQYFWHVQVLSEVTGDWSTVGNFIVRLPTEAPPPVIITQTPASTIILTQTLPPPTTQVTTLTNNVVNPSYIWAIIIIGAVLVIAIIVLIVRTRKS
jgi:hypothetical protein